jgi:hypothetical protein
MDTRRISRLVLAQVDFNRCPDLINANPPEAVSGGSATRSTNK